MDNQKHIAKKSVEAAPKHKPNGTADLSSVQQADFAETNDNLNEQIDLRGAVNPVITGEAHRVNSKNILYLQRKIGNYAVQRLLAQRKTDVKPTAAPTRKPVITPAPTLNIDFVQRKVGFEFEADLWNTFLVERPLTQPETTIRDGDRNAINLTATTAGGFTKPPKKGHVIEKVGTGIAAGAGTGFEMQADEKDADHGDVEFVTKPFSEDAAGYNDLRGTLEMMRSLMNHLVTLPTRTRTGAYNWPDEHGLAQNLLLSFGDRPMKVKPQVTGGIGLDKIGSVMENMGVVPGEAPTEATKRGDGRGKLLAANTLMAKILGGSPAMARSAIAHYLPARIINWSTVKDDFQDTSKLEGLVSMAIAYVKAGANVMFASYPKVLAPLMSRTDFATLFEMLPDEQKDYFKNHASVFVDLIIAGANSNIGFSTRDAVVSSASPMIQHFAKVGTDAIKASGGGSTVSPTVSII